MSLYYNHLEKLFDQMFCETIAKKFNFDDYKKAEVDIYGNKKQLNSIRNNYRLEFTSPEIAQKIHEKISKLNLLPIIEGKKYHSPSSNFRIYLYEEGHYFKPHKDGKEKQNDLESSITCLIYLNDANGGETILMPGGFSEKTSHITIKPKIGDMLLFEHQIWHEAKPVVSNKKLVLRTNLLYKN